MQRLTKIKPEDIERRSFEIIEQEFHVRTSHQPGEFDPRKFKVIQRVIHATGDFSFAESLRFHPNAIASGINAIRSGRNIYCDVSMGASGVSSKLLAAFGGAVFCHINDDSVAAAARRSGLTRSEIALSKLSGENVGIISIGNAPTALIRAMQMIAEGTITPALVVGVPVGFVNAAESKEILSEKEYPYITCLGRKGGTPVAVAIVNALIRLAEVND